MTERGKKKKKKKRVINLLYLQLHLIFQQFPSDKLTKILSAKEKLSFGKPCPISEAIMMKRKMTSSELELNLILNKGITGFRLFEKEKKNYL